MKSVKIDSSRSYKKGDFIGPKYEVHDVLGMGGFGIVYLIYDHESKSVLAFKTFRDKYLDDILTRERFHKEADVWINLDRHPFIVRAYFVFDYSGRLFIGMEYIAPGEPGLNSLDGFLRRQPPNLKQSIQWVIQICYGMEYAYSKGIRAHRDIKPSNIMIDQNKTVKISDFGLAGAIGASKSLVGIKIDIKQNATGLGFLKTAEGAGFGTPTHMPPEQFTNAASCDERSDIYSFGIVLYEMASGGNVPFLAPLPRDNSEGESLRFWREMYHLHRESSVPKINSLIYPIIQRCLGKETQKRFQTFKEIRIELEIILRNQAGEVIRPPKWGELEAWEWSNKGASLLTIGHSDEAISCFNKALKLDPRNVPALCNKAIVLGEMKHYDEAVGFCDKAIELDPLNATLWKAKYGILGSRGRLNEAIYCIDKAIELSPRNPEYWASKGNNLDCLGRFEEALFCLNKSLDLNSLLDIAWYNKAFVLLHLGRLDESVDCCKKAIEINPLDAHYWLLMGACLQNMEQYKEAIYCCIKCLEINPKNASGWNNKGISLSLLGNYDEAVKCFDNATEINPHNAGTWYNKANTEEKLGHKEDAINSYEQFLNLVSNGGTDEINYATQQIRKLKNELSGVHKQVISIKDSV